MENTAAILSENQQKLKQVQFDWRWILGIFVFVAGVLLLLGFSGPVPHNFDATGYWGLAWGFVNHKHFSLLNYDNHLRGYLYPLLLLPFRVVGHSGYFPEGILQISLGAAQAALLFGWVLPKLYSKIRPEGQFSLKRRFLFVGMGLFFWGGHFAYTLSDFPAMLAFAGGLLLLCSSSSGWTIFLAGICFGAALNTRPFYLLSTPFIALLLWKLTRDKGHWSRSLLRVAFLVGGFAAILAPQWRINAVNFGRNTPLVLTTVNKHDDLFLTQLAWGFIMLKMDTSFGGAEGGKNAQVIYYNKIGKPAIDQLLVARGVTRAEDCFTGVGDYISFAASHPIETVSTYILHLFAGFDLYHASPYSKANVNSFSLLLPWINYTLLFVFFLILVKGRVKAFTSTQVLALLVWLIPCSITLPVAMENRFLLPLHLLLYGFIAFEVADWQSIVGMIRSSKIKLAAFYGFFIALMFAVSLLIFSGRYIGIV